jgi:hypothetical protein
MIPSSSQMYYDYASTTCSTPSPSGIRITNVITSGNTRTQPNINRQRVDTFDGNTDSYDFESKYD